MFLEENVAEYFHDFEIREKKKINRTQKSAEEFPAWYSG